MVVEFHLNNNLVRDGNKRFKLINSNNMCFTNGTGFSLLEIVDSSNHTITNQCNNIKELYSQFFNQLSNNVKYEAVVKNLKNKLFSDGSSAAEKYQFYSEREVEKIRKEEPQKITSCRLDQAKKYVVKLEGSNFYPANNLNVSEFIYALIMYIPNELRGNFKLRVYNMEMGETLVSKEEFSEICNIDNIDDWNITIESEINSSNKKSSRSQTQTIITANEYIKRDIRKIKLGELGEYIVKQYLSNLPHFSKVTVVSENSSLGYDILCEENGIEKYIEVKTTRNMLDDGFYISLNEKHKFETLSNYEIYRVFNLNEKEKRASIKIYTKSDIKNLDFQAMQFYVKKK